MGKRSKMHKTGVPRASLKKKNLNSTIMNINPKKNQTMIAKPNYSSDEEEETQVKMNTSMNQSVNYDQESLKKYGSLLGLSDKEIESLALKPIRNRRLINNTVLSHRQKKKALRREKKKKIEEMEQKTKLNLSMAYPQPNFNHTFAARNQTPVVIEKKQFDLKELDKELLSLEKTTVPKHLSSIKMRTKRRRMKLLNEERENIDSVINKGAFNKNPLEAMAMHIKTSQLIAERNKKVQEDYNKHYNMLNLK